MGRALSWSLAAHAAFIISFLLLSATRQPLTIPQIARPVRLVTYLEPRAAPRQSSLAPADTTAARAAPVPVEPRVLKPPAASIPAPTASLPSAPVVAPRVVIPERGQAPTASRTPARLAEARPDFGEALKRKLASTIPEKGSPDEVPSPQLASLSSPEPAGLPRPASSPDRAPAGVPATAPGAVVPVGYFPYVPYLFKLEENIFSNWSPPSDPLPGNTPRVALVSFRIHRAGGIGGIALKESSGFARFDRSALAAIQGLGRVPALPEQYTEETLDVVIRFQNQK